MQKSYDKPPLYTAEFFKATAVFFLLYLTWGMLFPLPILIEKLGGDPLAIGLIMGATPAAAVLSRLALGPAMDRSGRKKILLLCAFLNAAAMFLFLTVRDAGWWPVALRLLLGVAYGGYFSVLFTIVSDHSPPERLAEGLGNFGIAGLLALALGPLLAEALGGASGDFRAVFIAGGLISLAAASAAASMKESRRPAFCETAIPAGEGVSNRAVLLVLVATVAFAASRGAAVSFLADYCLKRRIGSIGLYSLVYSLTTAVFRFLAGSLADRRGPGRIVIPCLLVFGASTALLALMSSVAVLLLSAFLGGLAHCFLYPALNALTVRKMSVCRRGTANGLFTAAFDFGLGAAAWLWGPLAEGAGYPPMFLAAGIVSGSGVLAAMSFQNGQESRGAKDGKDGKDIKDSRDK